MSSITQSIPVETSQKEPLGTPPFSIVVPAFNEGQSIATVLDQIQTACAGYIHEIIVVDDGSQDNTKEMAEQTGVTVIQHPQNRGYGAALKTGIRKAKYEIICITDADRTYPNERIPEFVYKIETGQMDMLVGARTGENVAIPFSRRPAKWVIGQLANFVAGYRIPDINSGFRIFKRSVAFGFWHLLPSGFSFTTTITLGMLMNHYLIGYTSIDYHVRVGKSKIKPIRDTINFVQLILRIALYFAPLKIFIPLSGLLLLVALGFGLFTHFVIGRLADVMTMVLVMAAFQVAVIGLLAELINQRLQNAYRKDDVGYYDDETKIR